MRNTEKIFSICIPCSLIKSMFLAWELPYTLGLQLGTFKFKFELGNIKSNKKKSSSSVAPAMFQMPNKHLSHGYH